jgi:hypothetical protein
MKTDNLAQENSKKERKRGKRNKIFHSCKMNAICNLIINGKHTHTRDVIKVIIEKTISIFY